MATRIDEIKSGGYDDSFSRIAYNMQLKRDKDTTQSSQASFMANAGATGPSIFTTAAAGSSGTESA